jgi:tetratricopeptide (TPR) repeat protein
LPLKLIKIKPWLAGVCLTAAAVLCVTTAWFFVKWNFVNAVASHIDERRPESILVADWLTQLAPADPQTHFTAAYLFEKTFEPDDLTRALSEYEIAAALSPHNYLMWLNLGKARSQNGDVEGAEKAYERALQLAPNYSSVQWVYGNLLLRSGKPDEGFALIAKAAVSNRDYSRTAMATALQLFEGDVGQVRRALGDSDTTNATLATTLAAQKRYDEAFDAWSRLAAGDKAAKFGELGDTLIAQLAEAKKFQLAARVTADLRVNESEKPVLGQILNGGFESTVKLTKAGPFEWTIAEGSEPQIGLTELQKRSGNSSLWMIFNSFKAIGFRPVSQTVAVVPGAEYEFEVFYKSDIKSSATLKWEIADAGTGQPIASTAAMTPSADWVSLKAGFKVPTASDGVIIRLVREGCIGSSCPMSGKISFDDISIRRPYVS